MSATTMQQTSASVVAPNMGVPNNMGIVMDVELNVTLRFGQRILTLKEVLDLKAGNVVELDRTVNDPVEVLLDGKVIALGEVVVIEGHYGVRVTSMPGPISKDTLFPPAVRD